MGLSEREAGREGGTLIVLFMQSNIGGIFGLSECLCGIQGSKTSVLIRE